MGDYVGTFGEEEAWHDFFGDGGAAKDAAAFEDQHFFPGFGQVGCVHETVVTASDDDHIVGLRHSLGLQTKKRISMKLGTKHSTGSGDGSQGVGDAMVRIAIPSRDVHEPRAG